MRKRIIRALILVATVILCVVVNVVYAGTIDIGADATNRNDNNGGDYTIIDGNNPANDSGSITTFELWFFTDGTGVEIGTFFGSPTTFTSRDYEIVGAVTAGSKQTFSGLDCSVETGDLVGFYLTTGAIEASTSGGTTCYFKSRDQFGEGAQTYNISTKKAHSAYGIGAPVVVAPTVTTQAATSIEDTTATGNGNITDTGGEDASAWGICWNLEGTPDTGDNVVAGTGAGGVGAFTAALTGLPTGRTIYARAYATNGGGTSYGAEVNWLTKPAAPTNVAATSNIEAKVTITWTASVGATDYHVFRGAVDLGASGNVTTEDDAGGTAATITNAGTVTASDGSSTSYVTLSLAGEATGVTEYAYTVVASNATGDSDASSPDNGNRSVGAITYQWQVDDGGGYDNIVGGTTDPYNYSSAPAGTISNAGTANASDGTDLAYVVLSLAGEATTNGAAYDYQCIVSASGASNSPQTSTNNDGYRGVGAITYQWQMSDADSDADYNTDIGTTDPYNATEAPSDGHGRYFRCEISSVDADNTPQISTVDRGYRAAVPTVTTQAAAVTSNTTATGNGNIIFWGSEPVNERGFEWDTDSGAPYSYNGTDADAWPTGAFTKAITDLPPGTLIYYRAKAGNSIGMGYGSELTFTTYAPPTVTTQAASAVGTIFATYNGNITNLNGDASCTVRGFVFDTVTHVDPGGSLPGDSGYSDILTATGVYTTGAYSRNATSLVGATDYFVRAFAKNTYGYNYGDEITFTTTGMVLWITWQYGIIFTDQSGHSNDATPTFRTASSDVNLTANISSQASTYPATLPTANVSGGWTMISTAPTAPTGLFTEGATTFPLGPQIEATANALGQNVEAWLFFFAYGLAALGAIGVFAVTHNTKMGQKGSLILSCLTAEGILIYFYIVSTIPGWSLIPLGIIAVLLLAWRKSPSPVD
jgi:hypothetical protein